MTKIIYFIATLFFSAFLPPYSFAGEASPLNTDRITGIHAGTFQNFSWVTIDDLKNGTLVFFNSLMVPLLQFENTGKLTHFRIEKSLLNFPLLELEYERHYSQNGVLYTAIVGELFEVYNNQIVKIYSYTKQLLYTVKKGREHKQIIFKGILKADETQANIIKFIIQTNQALPTLKASYVIDRFAVDETALEHSFKYQIISSTMPLDKPPLDIDLLGGGSSYKLIHSPTKRNKDSP